MAKPLERCQNVTRFFVYEDGMATGVNFGSKREMFSYFNDIKEIA